MNLTPINAPRIAPIPGAKTLAATEARDRAMSSFNAGLQTQGSPSQPGASIEPVVAATTTLNTQDLGNPPIINEVASEIPHEDEPAQKDLAEKEARLSHHYATLARREKMLRQREARLRQMAQTPPTGVPPQPAFDPSKYVSTEDLKLNPFGILNNLGLTYEDLTQKALDAPSHSELQSQREILALRSEIEGLKNAQKKVESNFEEQNVVARQQAEMQIRQDVNRLIAQDPSFEAIRADRANSSVARLITEVYDKGMGSQYPRGTILDVYEASQMVEDQLTDRAIRLAQLKKVQNRTRQAVAPPVTGQKQQTSSEAQSQIPPLRTLTNSIGSPTRKLTPRERALMVFRGENVT